MDLPEGVERGALKKPQKRGVIRGKGPRGGKIVLQIFHSVRGVRESLLDVVDSSIEKKKKKRGGLLLGCRGYQQALC